MTEKLKRCPFCGGAARYQRGAAISDHVYVQCRRITCFATVVGVDAEEAAAMWNRRVAEKEGA